MQKGWVFFFGISIFLANQRDLKSDSVGNKYYPSQLPLVEFNSFHFLSLSSAQLVIRDC